MALWDAIAQPPMYRGIAHTTKPGCVAMVGKYAKDVADISLVRHASYLPFWEIASQSPNENYFPIW